MLTPEQESAINQASLNLLETTINTVGVAATVQLLDTVTSIVREEPGFARKLADPKVQAGLLELGAEYKTKMKGKKPGLTDAIGTVMPMLGRIKLLLD